MTDQQKAAELARKCWIAHGEQHRALTEHKAEMQAIADITTADILLDTFKEIDNEKIRLTEENPNSDDAKIAEIISTNLFTLARSAQTYAGLDKNGEII